METKSTDEISAIAKCTELKKMFQIFEGYSGAILRFDVKLKVIFFSTSALDFVIRKNKILRTPSTVRSVFQIDFHEVKSTAKVRGVSSEGKYYMVR